jgi:transcriptional regulator with XRE-family HTH domain
MISFPPFLEAHDISHLGILFKRIRTTRGLSQSDIAQALAVTNSTISKFESTGRSRRAQIIERYIRTLQSPTLNGSQAPCPLDEDEATLLMQLSSEYHGANGDALTVQLGAYDFELIASPNSPSELKVLAQRLRQMPWPALISDGLGFIHAVNSAMLNLFGIEPNSVNLRRWESWHTLATMFTHPSPIRSAYVNLDSHFPTLIYDFFQSTVSSLFTPQMRALLRELHHLSDSNDLNFSKWWYAASTFNLFFKQRPSTFILRHGARFLNTTVFERECHWVHIAANMRVPYYLGIWQPLGSETEAIFERLPGMAAPGEIFFAADFDAHHAYHVNCWPEVAQLLQLEY